MQKKLIALAVAGLVSGGAFAQSTNVTMYGVVDMGYARVTAGGKSTTSMIDNGLLGGSRLGFKGTEDLGSGLKAVFALEYMLEPDDNLGVGATSKWTGTATRNAYVGLNGSFGTVLAGRVQGIGFAHACATGATPGSAWDGYGSLGASTVVTCGTAGRHSNAAGWVSNKMGDFTLAYNHARLTETAGSATTLTGKDSSANVFGVTYANGPLFGSFVYAKVSAEATVAADDVTEMALGGSYNFGAAKVFADYRSNKVEGKSRDKRLGLGVSVPVSAMDSVALQYGTNGIDSTAASDDSTAISLQYLHEMSKRTKVYAAYGRLNNDGTAVRAFGGYAPVAGDSASVVAFGVNHSF